MATLSTSFKWTNATPASLDPTQVNNSSEYKRFTSKRALKHRWGWDLHLDKTAYASVMDFYGFVVAQGGRGGIFNLPNPLPPIGTGEVSTAAQTSTSIAQGQASIPADSLQVSKTGIYKVGDFVKFANHAKVYMVSEQLDSNGAGQGTFEIYPSLFADVPEDTVINFGEDVLFQVSLESDASDILLSGSDALNADPKIDVVEVG